VRAIDDERYGRDHVDLSEFVDDVMNFSANFNELHNDYERTGQILFLV